MEIRCEKGVNVGYDEYMKLINDTFGFTGTDIDFKTKLPKLYRPGRRPQDSNYVILEDGRCVAAVGAFDHRINVCGIDIPCRGIGNVAVSKDCRSKGYMKQSMNAALSDMVKDGIALSTLGGRRHRYRYFSYDGAGVCYTFSINRDNLKHVFGKDRTVAYPDVIVLTPDRKDLLENIQNLSSRSVFNPCRNIDDLYDILSTWEAKVYCVTSGEKFIGYAVVEGDAFITEIQCNDKSDFTDMLVSIFDTMGFAGISVRLPVFEKEYIQAISRFCEGVSIGCSMMYNVLDYQTVILASMRLLTTYDRPCDASLKLLIHGFAKDERLILSYANGIPSVETIPETEKVDIELSHLDAIAFLFGPVSPYRDNFPPVIRQWLPLPLWMFRADEV